MKQYAEKIESGKSRSVAQATKGAKSTTVVVDNRPEMLVQRKLQVQAQVHSTPGLKTTSQISSVQSLPIQRFQPVDLQGELDEESYQNRAGAEGRGINAFGGDNLGRAMVTLASGETRTHFAPSLHGHSHSEETLIATIKEKYGAEALTNDPRVAGQTRITHLYTERAPCSPENAEYSRRSRAATDRSCSAYLARVIHPATPVAFSVANDPGQHGRLMAKGFGRYIREVVHDQRRITYQNAINRSPAYFAQFRSACFARYGSYGRNYYGEAHRTKQFMDQFGATIQAMGLPIDYRGILNNAFMSVPFYDGSKNESEKAMHSIETAAQQIQQQLDAAMTPFLDASADQMDAAPASSSSSAAPSARFRPGPLALAQIRPFPGRGAPIDPERREQMRKDQELAKKIRGDRK
ncbi:hypothetical protein [Marinoscillum sp.]|uniref:hypothetical protein n=1 Tax=Marinoscillum sp. TaxID=2024838 RepID=UPI003BA85812